MNRAGFELELARLIRDHELPDSYHDLANRFYKPLIVWLLERIDRLDGETYVLGIYGAQGSGKSTLAELLFRYLTIAEGRSVANISLDDFYLTRKERRQLACEVHPLLASRGPPGTHDVGLALATLNRAKTLSNGELMTVPRFDKASDDRKPAAEWSSVSGPVDVVVLEGWCLGCAAVEPKRLLEPINELEREEDKDGTWRRYVNDSIAAYQPLFELIDGLVMLKTAKFDAVLDWRYEQERKLRMSQHSSE
ncbi:MAG: phosphoribulokinase, partial [Halioglobus sp.]|nr:phosphoribulokinase [Halioglobus sp.]